MGSDQGPEWFLAMEPKPSRMETKVWGMSCRSKYLQVYGVRFNLAYINHNQSISGYVTQRDCFHATAVAFSHGRDRSTR